MCENGKNILCSDGIVQEVNKQLSDSKVKCNIERNKYYKNCLIWNTLQVLIQNYKIQKITGENINNFTQIDPRIIDGADRISTRLLANRYVNYSLNSSAQEDTLLGITQDDLTLNQQQENTEKNVLKVLFYIK